MFHSLASVLPLQRKSCLRRLITAASIAFAVLANGQDFDSTVHLQIVQLLIEGDYSSRGADACLGCHDEEEPFPTSEIFATVHGHPEIDGSPFSSSDPENYPHGLQCEACHGPAGEHTKKLLAEGEIRQPMLNFGSQANVRSDLQNQMCLACHEDYNRSHWQHSAHERSLLACTDCHEIHDREDSVRLHASHNDFCVSCHQDVGASMFQRSSHPMRESTLVCRDCHDPHGGKVDASGLVREKTLNEVCLGCHQEKVGPFVWEHPPVAEDCGICHVPHGSSQPALLVRRPPQLCQECHSSVGHRSLRMDPDTLPSDPNAEFLFLSACLNCHSQVHGSNHPSGNLFRK